MTHREAEHALVRMTLLGLAALVLLKVLSGCATPSDYRGDKVDCEYSRVQTKVAWSCSGEGTVSIEDAPGVLDVLR